MSDKMREALTPVGYGPYVRPLTPEELADLRAYLGSMRLDQMGVHVPNLLATLDAELTESARLREAARAVVEAQEALNVPTAWATSGRREVIVNAAHMDRLMDAIDALYAALASETASHDCFWSAQPLRLGNPVDIDALRMDVTDEEVDALIAEPEANARIDARLVKRWLRDNGPDLVKSRDLLDILHRAAQDPDDREASRE